MRSVLPTLLVFALGAPGHAGGPVVLYSNGPIVDLPGAGPGGAHAGRVQGELGMTRLGFGGTLSTPSSSTWEELSDDFTIETPGT